MPAKNSGMRFIVLYGYGVQGKARFNREGDAMRCACLFSEDGHEAAVWSDRFLARYRAGERIAHYDPFTGKNVEGS